MELKMNFNSFIKLKDFFKLIDISAEVEEFHEQNELIEGKLNIKGKYTKRDNITTDYFSELIPFTIIISSQNYEVEDIFCVDIEYVVVESRGFDVTFDIFVKYNILDDFELREDENINDDLSITTEPSTIDFEEIKENETKRMDELLLSNLNIKEDNYPTDEIIIRNLSEQVSNIKICYYENEKELDKICENNNISLNDVLNNNKKYSNYKYKRVFLSSNE